MVRNDPNNPIQRSVVVDRHSSYAVKALLASVIHGYKSPDSDIPVSLIILEFSFIPLKATRRIKSAKISLQFKAERENRPDPKISAIAPNGKFSLNPSSLKTTTVGGRAGTDPLGFVGVGASIGMQWEKTVTQEIPGGSLIGMTEIRGRNHGFPNTAVWMMNEGQVTQTGVPSWMQTAVMVERRDDDIFLGVLEIEIDVAGFSFRDFQSGRADTERDDAIIFDPSFSPMGPETGLDKNELGRANIEDFVSITLESPIFTTAEDILQNEQVEHANQQIVGELFESVVPEPEQTLIRPQNLGSSSSLYVELWNVQLSGTQWVPMKSSNVKAPSSRFSIPSEDLPSELSTKHLERYFAWIREKPPPPPSPERQEEPRKQTTLCSLIFRRSDRKGFASFDELKELLGQPPVQSIVDFFELPEDYKFSRHHDRGICQLISSLKDGKPLKAYMIQTPFYGRGGFWSLVLICMTESDAPDSPSKTSAVIQTDQESDPSKLFQGVQGLAKLYGRHPMLLPLELFRTHCRTTSKRFGALLADVKRVDERLLAELETESKPEDARKEYRELSRILHKCNMELEELGRRRKFEEKFGKQLSEDLRYNSGLNQIATMFADISKSRDVDMESLPGKMDSQRNVLSSLIAQYDNNTSSKLAKESLRDSKAMKTLSILTILFLPGAFVATVFSTDMFDFRDKNQEIWIYFVIVVPLTAIIMTGWYLWLKNTPDNGDEEAGGARPKENSKGDTKEGKSD